MSLRFAAAVAFNQPARVEYLRPVCLANWAADTPLRSNSAKMTRRCSLDAHPAFGVQRDRHSLKLVRSGSGS